MPTLLDDLSGYEFEDATASLFRELGYEDVSVATRVADKGRDITMFDGDTAYVVECKHTDTVSRPVVQKLHSAVATHDHGGPKRGTIVTSGRFTAPAEEYAARLATGDPHPIELIDGQDLREFGESVGMDLYNGRIEIVCEETLPIGDPRTVLESVFEDVENAPATPPEPTLDVSYRPVVDVEARTRATFETSVGVIHRIDREDRLGVEADPSGPRVAPSSLAALTDADAVSLSAVRSGYDGETLRFGRTESEYREWVKDRLCDRLETTVSYTGGKIRYRSLVFVSLPLRRRCQRDELQSFFGEEFLRSTRQRGGDEQATDLGVGVEVPTERLDVAVQLPDGVRTDPPPLQLENDRSPLVVLAVHVDRAGRRPAFGRQRRKSLFDEVRRFEHPPFQVRLASDEFDRRLVVGDERGGVADGAHPDDEAFVGRRPDALYHQGLGRGPTLVFAAGRLPVHRLVALVAVDEVGPVRFQHDVSLSRPEFRGRAAVVLDRTPTEKRHERASIERVGDERFGIGDRRRDERRRIGAFARFSRLFAHGVAYCSAEVKRCLPVSDYRLSRTHVPPVPTTTPPSPVPDPATARLGRSLRRQGR